VVKTPWGEEIRLSQPNQQVGANTRSNPRTIDAFSTDCGRKGDKKRATGEKTREKGHSVIQRIVAGANTEEPEERTDKQSQVYS